MLHLLTLCMVRHPHIFSAVRKRASDIMLRQLELLAMILRVQRGQYSVCRTLLHGRRVSPGQACRAAAKGDKVQGQGERAGEDADEGDDDATVPQDA